MIKLFALIFMLIDHVGIILFPDCFVLRLLGRLAMPLYAYCIARGYFYSSQKGTLKKYFINVGCLFLISQYPFYVMEGSDWTSGLNTCATWLLAIVLLYLVERIHTLHDITKTVIAFTIIILIQRSTFLHTDYRFYGVLTPMVFYYTFFKEKIKIHQLPIWMVVLNGFYVFVEAENQSLMQMLSLAAIPLIMILRKKDSEIRIPKWIFYVFYPLHIMVLLIIRKVVLG
ncbi:MAG: hypothetical protein E7290_10180 [Lachnospiraceae bacterium]|nr:hypothetical protein [Lachnospiraceae bacterium]